jgi:hypothetical protein
MPPLLTFVQTQFWPASIELWSILFDWQASSLLRNICREKRLYLELPWNPNTSVEVNPQIP